MSENGEPESVPRKQRPSIEVPRSVLNIVEERTGDAPRVSLREEDSAAGGTPPIDPGTAERLADPGGRGTYSILGEIARGGMGVVLRGHDTDLGRDVAMKVLSKDLADRPEVVQRFIEEAQIGGQLQHPGIVPVYELGLMADERPYFTMKLVKGRTLAMLLAERKTPAAERSRMIDVFGSVCQTMAYAHSRGVIHRDLKPANIMVGAFGEVQVVDWGLAKVLARGGVADERQAKFERTELTVLETVRSDGSSTGTDSLVGSVLGTPAYMPPEQASGMVDRLDERSDVFALGAILCEILTGAPPYSAEQEKTLTQAAQAELDDAMERLEGCDADPELVKLAKSCLVAAKAARPRNAGVLAESVRQYLETTEERARAAEIAAVEARVHAQEARRAHRLTLALAVSIVGILVLGGGFWFRKERAERDEVARVERGLDELRGQVLSLQTAGLSDEALVTARNALVLVDGRPEGDALRESAESFVSQTEGLAANARDERERVERDAALLTRLEELRLDAAQPLSPREHATMDEAFAEAFRTWGLVVDEDIVQSLEVLRASGLEAELAPALDDWASVRRWAYGWRSLEAEAMNALAADLDPEPLRVRLREALMERDVESLLAIAADPAADELPASTAWVLGNALKDLGQPEVAMAQYVRAIRRHPGDLRLRISAAVMATAQNLPEANLRHITAAVALRPNMAELAFMEGVAHAHLSRWPAARESFERAVRADPRNARALFALGSVLFGLGEEEEALEVMRRCQELGFDQPELYMIQGVLEAVQGELELDELEELMSRQTFPFAQAGTVWAHLAVEPSRSDLVHAQELMHAMPDPPFQAAPSLMLLETQLALALDDPHETRRLVREFLRRDDVFPKPDEVVQLLAVEASALARLGEREQARERLAEARAIMAPLLAEDPTAWEPTVPLRLLRQAEAEVGG